MLDTGGENEKARSSRDAPRSPFEDLENRLDDLLGSFPDPATLGTPVSLADSQDGHYSLDSEMVDKECGFSPGRVMTFSEVIALDEGPTSRPPPPSRSTSSNSKRGNNNENENGSPNRPFKRLREAFTKASPKNKQPIEIQTHPPSPSKNSRGSNSTSPVRSQSSRAPSRQALNGSPTRSRGHARSPSKIPLPNSPTVKSKTLPAPPRSPLPPLSAPAMIPAGPTEEHHSLEEIVRSFRYTRTHLDRSILALENAQTDMITERRRSEDVRVELERVKGDLSKKNETILEAWGEVEDLKVALEKLQKQKEESAFDSRKEAEELQATIKRVRAENGKATSEAQGMIHRLETRLAEANKAIEALRGSLETLEQSSDKSVFQLRQRLDAAQQEEARAKEEMGGMKRRLEEAEFAHRALKEGGAKLARDLYAKEKRIVELERALSGGQRRGGMV